MGNDMTITVISAFAKALETKSEPVMAKRKQQFYYEGPEEEKNFNTLLEIINSMEVREDDKSFQNPVDILFKDLAERDPNHFAVRQYAKFKLAAGVAAKSVLMVIGMKKEKQK